MIILGLNAISPHIAIPLISLSYFANAVDYF